MLGSRRRGNDKQKPRKKPKWQEALDEDEDGGTAAIVELKCAKCDGQRECVLFCETCKKYFCRPDFISGHPNPEDLTDSDNDRTTSQIHSFRACVGVEGLGEELEVGWIAGSEEPQVLVIKARKAKEEQDRLKKEQEEAERKKEEEEAKARAEAAQEESKDDAASPTGEEKQVPGTGDGATEAQKSAWRCVFVSNIDYQAKPKEVRQLFNQAGKVVDMRMPTNESARGGVNSSQHKGLAWIEFDSHEDAQKAVATLHSKMLHSRALRVILNESLGLPSQREIEKSSRQPKTRMCSWFVKGTCYRGPSCSFAHHPRELEGTDFQKQQALQDLERMKAGTWRRTPGPGSMARPGEKGLSHPTFYLLYGLSLNHLAEAIFRS
eukprot:g62139.t1